MTVLENILPTQRHLILVCQNYSVCLKNWPRAPELQGKEGEKETAGEEAALFRMLDLGISFSPKQWAFCSSFHTVSAGMCPLWPVFFIRYKKCLLFSLMVRKRRDLHTHAHWLFVPHGGSRTQWLLCSAAIGTGTFRCSKFSCSF